MSLFGKKETKQNEKAIKIFTEKLNELEEDVVKLYMESYLEKNGFYKALDVLYGKTDMVTSEDNETPMKVRNKEIEDAMKKVQFCKGTMNYMQTVPFSKWKPEALVPYRTDEIAKKENEMKELKEFISSLAIVSENKEAGKTTKSTNNKTKKKEGGKKS